MAMSKGGSFLSPDGQKFQGYLDSTASVETIKWYKDRVKEGVFHADYIQNVLNEVSLGRVAMFVTYYNLVPTIKPEYKAEIGVAAWPKFAGGTRVVNNASLSIGISKSTKQVQAAWDYLKLFAMDKNEITERLLKEYDLIKDDPFYAVKQSMLPYVKKDLTNQNASYYTIANTVREQLTNVEYKRFFC